jgi:hypothetical protein
MKDRLPFLLFFTYHPEKKKQFTKTFDSLIPPMIIIIDSCCINWGRSGHAVNVYVQGTAGPAVLQTNQGLSHTVGLVA